MRQHNDSNIEKQKAQQQLQSKKTTNHIMNSSPYVSNSNNNKKIITMNKNTHNNKENHHHPHSNNKVIKTIYRNHSLHISSTCYDDENEGYGNVYGYQPAQRHGHTTDADTALKQKDTNCVGGGAVLPRKRKPVSNASKQIVYNPSYQNKKPLFNGLSGAINTKTRFYAERNISMPHLMLNYSNDQGTGSGGWSNKGNNVLSSNNNNSKNNPSSNSNSSSNKMFEFKGIQQLNHNQKQKVGLKQKQKDKKTDRDRDRKGKEKEKRPSTNKDLFLAGEGKATTASTSMRFLKRNSAISAASSLASNECKQRERVISKQLNHPKLQQKLQAKPVSTVNPDNNIGSDNKGNSSICGSESSRIARKKETSASSSSLSLSINQQDPAAGSCSSRRKRKEKEIVKQKQKQKQKQMQRQRQRQKQRQRQRQRQRQSQFKVKRSNTTAIADKIAAGITKKDDPLLVLKNSHEVAKSKAIPFTLKAWPTLNKMGWLNKIHQLYQSRQQPNSSNPSSDRHEQCKQTSPHSSSSFAMSTNSPPSANCNPLCVKIKLSVLIQHLQKWQQQQLAEQNVTTKDNNNDTATQLRQYGQQIDLHSLICFIKKVMKNDLKVVSSKGGQTSSNSNHRHNGSDHNKNQPHNQNKLAEQKSSFKYEKCKLSFDNVGRILFSKDIVQLVERTESEAIQNKSKLSEKAETNTKNQQITNNLKDKVGKGSKSNLITSAQPNNNTSVHHYSTDQEAVQTARFQNNQENCGNASVSGNEHIKASNCLPAEPLHLQMYQSSQKWSNLLESKSSKSKSKAIKSNNIKRSSSISNHSCSCSHSHSHLCSRSRSINSINSMNEQSENEIYLQAVGNIIQNKLTPKKQLISKVSSSASANGNNTSSIMTNGNIQYKNIQKNNENDREVVPVDEQYYDGNKGLGLGLGSMAFQFQPNNRCQNKGRSNVDLMNARQVVNSVVAQSACFAQDQDQDGLTPGADSNFSLSNMSEIQAQTQQPQQPADFGTGSIGAPMGSLYASYSQLSSSQNEKDNPNPNSLLILPNQPSSSLSSQSLQGFNHNPSHSNQHSSNFNNPNNSSSNQFHIQSLNMLNSTKQLFIDSVILNNLYRNHICVEQNNNNISFSQNTSTIKVNTEMMALFGGSSSSGYHFTSNPNNDNNSLMMDDSNMNVLNNDAEQDVATLTFESIVQQIEQIRSFMKEYSAAIRLTDSEEFLNSSNRFSDQKGSNSIYLNNRKQCQPRPHSLNIRSLLNENSVSKAQDFSQIDQFLSQLIDYKMYRRAVKVSGQNGRSSSSSFLQSLGSSPGIKSLNNVRISPSVIQPPLSPYFNSVKLTSIKPTSKKALQAITKLLNGPLIREYFTRIQGVCLTQIMKVIKFSSSQLTMAQNTSNPIRSCLFSNLFQNNKSLKILNLAGNQISSLDQISSIVSKNRQVQFINLSSNHLKSSKSLFQVLMCADIDANIADSSHSLFNCLKQIHLKNNQIAQIGFTGFSKLSKSKVNSGTPLPKNPLPALQILDLRKNNLDINQKNEIISLIQAFQHSSLSILALKENPIILKNNSQNGFIEHSQQRREISQQILSLLNCHNLYEYESLQMMSQYIKYKDITFFDDCGGLGVAALGKQQLLCCSMQCQQYGGELQSGLISGQHEQREQLNLPLESSIKHFSPNYHNESKANWFINQKISNNVNKRKIKNIKSTTSVTPEQSQPQSVIIHASAASSQSSDISSIRHSFESIMFQ